MENYYDRFRVVPEEAKKTIGGGKLKGMTDINPMWRIKMLTEAFGPCGIGWYYTTDKEWIEPVGEEICAFVDISLYIEVDGIWSKPIKGTGGSKLAAMEKSGIYASDECYKMATTDALSVACKMLGMGADVYWDKDRTKYSGRDDEMVKAATFDEKKTKQNKPDSNPVINEEGDRADAVENLQRFAPSRAEMVKCVNRFYPEGSEKRNQLFGCWKIKSLDDATIPMLMVVWNKYGGK